MHLPEVKALHTGTDAAADGVILNDTAWRLNDRNKRDEVTLEIIDNGVTSFSIQPKQANALAGPWYNLGSAIVAAALVTIADVKLPFFKAEVTAIINNGSDIDVNAS